MARPGYKLQVGEEFLAMAGASIILYGALLLGLSVGTRGTASPGQGAIQAGEGAADYTGKPLPGGQRQRLRTMLTTERVTVTAPAAHDAVCVARQPILDRSGRVFGYELLYRPGPHANASGHTGDPASARMLTDAMLTLGLETLVNGRTAFLNLTDGLLRAGVNGVVPRRATVLELREDIEADAHAIDACRRLHGHGYTLALDDFIPGSAAEAFLPYASYVKVDVLQLGPAERQALAARVGGTVRLVAEKVETVEMFDETRAEGFSLFQGYYFCRPMNVTGHALPPRQLAQLQLLATINRPDATLADVEAVIKQDVALSYRVLRCVNSAGFGQHREIASIRQALVLLGLDTIRQWASVWAIAGLTSRGPSELTTMALIRARACEALGHRTHGADGAGLFLLGLCSLLEAMLEVPLPRILEELPLAPDVRDGLLGRPTAGRTVLDAVLTYERGGWTNAFATAARAGLDEASLVAAYTDAMRWARELPATLLAH